MLKLRNSTRDTKKLMSVSESELVSDLAPASCSSLAEEEVLVLEAVFTMVDCSSLSVPVTAGQNYSIETFFLTSLKSLRLRDLLFFCYLSWPY